jgi:hypothetical protein
MRRYFLYLTVAILAFSLGILIAFNLYWKAETPTLQVQLNEQTQWQNVIENSQIQTVNERLTCNDKSLQPFWNELKKSEQFNNLDEFYQWLNGQKDKPHDCSEFFRVSKEVDLNDDNEKEIFIAASGIGFSDNAANGVFYIFQNQQGIYKKILFDEASLSQEILRTKTNGYFDIELRDNDRLGEGSINIYKFDGQKYKLKNCFTRIWKIFKDGDVKELKKPLLTANKCHK